MVNGFFNKPKNRTVPIRNVFEAQYRENKASNMQESFLMKKIIHWFIKKLYKRGTSVALLILDLYSIRKYHTIPGSLLVMYRFLKINNKYYLFYDCECPSINSLEYYTWVVNVQSDINNSCKLVLASWYTNKKWLCLESKQRYINVIGNKYHGDMKSLNTVVQKVQNHMNKNNMSYPGDVKLLPMPILI